MHPRWQRHRVLSYSTSSHLRPYYARLEVPRPGPSSATFFETICISIRSHIRIHYWATSRFCLLIYILSSFRIHFTPPRCVQTDVFSTNTQKAHCFHNNSASENLEKPRGHNVSQQYARAINNNNGKFTTLRTWHGVGETWFWMVYSHVLLLLQL